MLYLSRCYITQKNLKKKKKKKKKKKRYNILRFIYYFFLMICFFSHFDKKYKFRFYMKQCIFIYVPILTKNNILFGNINDIK
ncbi:hypothetical protein PFMC_00980 [Plasmodium falciparum CAMP/Malaysia]|uniref:Uncharacterized protein n=1 Tax=Plasmodium falciparum (isolate Camp / Malaysia) TaxID=5835 RepID=A0A024XC16_PLAFC|nr:hypothetical protein PFMC_00980 [Plasmodium falciparum CAMP/Malaysia]